MKLYNVHNLNHSLKNEMIIVMTKLVHELVQTFQSLESILLTKAAKDCNCIVHFRIYNSKQICYYFTSTPLQKTYDSFEENS